MGYINSYFKLLEDFEDDINVSDQKYSSANTSINSSKLPVIFSLIDFKPNTVNLDYGGGKFDNATEFLAQKDVKNLIFDPYNRSSAHNQEMLKEIRDNGGADTATLSNVLNVIQEKEIRKEVLENIKKLLKPSGTLYITVYEGKGNSEESETKAGYQLNRKTADYIDESAEVFPTVSRKGKLIIAR